ncbi:transposase domain-containing protein [Pseudomonas sp. MSSRFD41]|nr:transposase domain-containing protein [Pseudomonas sp. MSSRFD41]
MKVLVHDVIGIGLVARRLNGLDPYVYFKDVVTRLPTQRAFEIDQLLPHKWTHICHCS